MKKECVINVDLADVFKDKERKEYLHTLALGDSVEVTEITDKYIRINTPKYIEQKDGSIIPEMTTAYIVPKKDTHIKPEDVVIDKMDNKILKVNFIDVQQGDAAVIESPDGKIILVDGGDNQLFARYLAARFQGTSKEKPKEIDCIVVSHGDADHFAGLSEIYKSETYNKPKKYDASSKRLFIAPKRVYHNGLVKRSGKDKNNKPVPDVKLFGQTVSLNGDTIITNLVDNLLEVPDNEMNSLFKTWKKTLAAWNKRKKIEFKNLAFGDDHAFDFFNNDSIGLSISVLGPILTEKGNVKGLKFLGAPPKGPRIGNESLSLDTDGFKGCSASHTINGHSVVFKLTYGGFSYLFTGDINDQSSRILAQKHQNGEINLKSEIFKDSHHGSKDFSGVFLQMVSPVVSVISSGDENSRKEYIHPSATLMGALGRYSRIAEPLIFVTELVAFFKTEDEARLVDKAKDKKRGPFFAFSRAAYGIVKTRTDGRRLLVYTDSGKVDLKEAYCYKLDEACVPVPVPVNKV